nr:hypothetical protein [Myxococcota bacterium]
MTTLDPPFSPPFGPPFGPPLGTPFGPPLGPPLAPSPPGPASREPTRAQVVPAAVLLFAIMAAHALLETARDALFLTRLGPDRLAWAYIVIAVAALGTVAAVRHWSRVPDPRRLLVGFLGFAAIGTAVLGATLSLAPSIVFVLYVWTGLIATLVVPAFWIVIDRSLRIADAKRSFAAIAAGGGLGALAGSALAATLGGLVDARHLVTVGAGVFVVASIAAVVLAPAPIAEAPRRAPRAQTEADAAKLRSHRHVRLLLLLGIISTVALTLGDLMFKRLLAERIPSEQLAVVFGATYTGLNVLGLVVQVAITPRLLDRLGVGGALTVLPAVVLASTLGFVVTGAAIAVIALKLGDGAFRHSVHRVASEILYLPLAASIRDAAKPVVDVIGQRGGQALAAIMTLAVATNAGGTRVLGLMTAAAIVIWLLAIALTRSSYIQQFRDTLDAGEIQRDVRIPTLDADSIAMLTSSLSSPDEHEALAALDLLGRRGDRIPALVLYHPSAIIVRRALSLIEGNVRPDIVRVLGQLTAHPDPQIRAAALAASGRAGCHAGPLEAALADPE